MIKRAKVEKEQDEGSFNMSRKARITFPSMLSHIISRGNHRGAVFVPREQNCSYKCDRNYRSSLKSRKDGTGLFAREESTLFESGI
jgi:hypothetical protein